MKKYLLLFSILFLSAQSSLAFDGGLISPAIYDAGAINARNLQMLHVQQFRRQEFNDSKTIQEVKEQHQKELDESVIEERPLFHKIINGGSARFIEYEGKIKIENTQ